jgi:hypothetical protein
VIFVVALECFLICHRLAMCAMALIKHHINILDFSGRGMKISCVSLNAEHFGKLLKVLYFNQICIVYYFMRMFSTMIHSYDLFLISFRFR